MGNLSILTFENGMAVCRVFRTADSSTDKVVVNVTLYRGWDVVGPGQARAKAAPPSPSRSRPWRAPSILCP